MGFELETLETKSCLRRWGLNSFMFVYMTTSVTNCSEP